MENRVAQAQLEAKKQLTQKAELVSRQQLEVKKQLGETAPSDETTS